MKSPMSEAEGSLSVSQDSSIFASRELDVSGSTEASMTPRSSETSLDLFSSSSGSLKVPRDDVDFGGEVDDETKPKKLIRTLDLSSNQLRSLSELCVEVGSGQVFRRLGVLKKLDLKQNQLTELPRELMQVHTSTRAFTSLDSFPVCSHCMIMSAVEQSWYII